MCLPSTVLAQWRQVDCSSWGLIMLSRDHDPMTPSHGFFIRNLFYDTEGLRHTLSLALPVSASVLGLVLQYGISETLQIDLSEFQ